MLYVNGFKINFPLQIVSIRFAYVVGLDDIQKVDYDAVRNRVLDGPGLDMTKNLQRDHSKAALKVLNQLPESDARTALANIIVAMQD